MAYLAIKKVKGRYYGYMQESYREGGSVKTRTVEYLGAIEAKVAQQYQATRKQLGAADMAALVQSVRDASTAATRASDAPPEAQTTQQARKPTTDDTPEQRYKRMTVNGRTQLVDTKTGELIEPDNRVITTPPPPGVVFPKGFDKLPIGRGHLQSAHRRYREKLNKLGIDPATMPTVRFAYDHPERLKRHRDGSFTVYVSRNPKRRVPIRRDLLWQHYRQALAEGYLATIEAQHPELHHRLHVALSASHRAGKRLIFDALTHAKGKALGLKLSLQLLLWDSVPRPTRKADPTAYGVASFDTVNDWQGEAAIILASTAKKGGWEALAKDHENTIRAHKAMITRRRNDLAESGLLDKLSGKRAKILRELLEAETKLKATRNLKARAELLRRVLEP